MVKAQIEFIAFSPFDQTNPSQREAIRAQIRSHAARVTYVCPHKTAFARPKSKSRRGRRDHLTRNKNETRPKQHSVALTARHQYPNDDLSDEDVSSLEFVTDRLLAIRDMNSVLFDANNIVLDSMLLSGSDAPMIDLSFLYRQSSYGSLLHDLPIQSHHIFADWVQHQMAQHSDVRHIVSAILYAREDARAGKAFSPAVYFHKGQAYSDLKKRLSTQTATTGEGWIFAVVLLGFLEVALGDRSAFEIHRTHWGETMTRRGKALSIVPAFTTLAHMKL